jgi:hypothetical protein
MAIFDSKFPWFPMPNHLIVDPLDKDIPGPWSTFSVGDLRLYLVLYMECNNKGHLAVITNKYLRTFSGLNRTQGTPLLYGSRFTLSAPKTVKFKWSRNYLTVVSQ